MIQAMSMMANNIIMFMVELAIWGWGVRHSVMLLIVEVVERKLETVFSTS